jgi:hypothetical protein
MLQKKNTINIINILNNINTINIINIINKYIYIINNSFYFILSAILMLMFNYDV